MNDKTKSPRTLTGVVVSNKMHKTISVAVPRVVKHPMYGKFVRRKTKLLAHDEQNECREGDLVVIESSRPISRRKAWRLQKIVSRAQQA
jgi:small subunit ribosomal protein S17